MVTAAAAVENILPQFAPCLIALSVTGLLVSFSNSLPNDKRVSVQFTIFGSMLAGGVGVLLQNSPDKFAPFWAQFIALPPIIKFAISAVAISATYFGGALYSIGLSSGSTCSSGSGSVNASPALADCSLEFEVPANLPADDKVFFEEIFTKLTKEIVNDLPTLYELPAESVEWCDRMINYTVAGGKMNRGLACLAVVKTFAKAKGRQLSNKERCQAAALGWCIEFLQAFFLVADDVMDGSVTRRNLPCWFRREEVNLIAINDSFILESCVYKILKRYFGAENYYSQLVDLFIEVTRQTEFGQLLDLTSQPAGGEIDLNRFTSERYTSIVRYKTAFYSFYLPVALGMIVAGVTDRKQYDIARKIMLIMGEYFQIQDDVLDCFGDPEVIGKVGTDIQDNKCSWLVVQALKMCTDKQRTILVDNYGKHDMRKVNKVKKLYKDLDLEGLFAAYEEKSYADIMKLLEDVKEMPHEVFTYLLGKIYKRSK